MRIIAFQDKWLQRLKQVCLPAKNTFVCARYPFANKLTVNYEMRLPSIENEITVGVKYKSQLVLKPSLINCDIVLKEEDDFLSKSC